VSAPLVSFVVLNWHAEEATRRCVESVLRQRADVPVEILVVDNESSPESRERLSGGTWRVLPLDRNRGFTGGMNAGAAAARGQFVALLNNDLVLADDWLERGLAAMEDSSVGIVGGRSDGHGHGFSLPRVDPEHGFTELLRVAAPRARVATVDGSHLLVRRTAWEQIGGFDEDFFAYYEEADLCARAAAGGWTVLYDPALRVGHDRGLSSGRRPLRRTYWARRNRLVFIAKHFPEDRWRRMTGAAAAEYASDAVKGRRGERLANLLAALWWATHLHRLQRKRRATIAAGQHDEAYAERLRELYQPAPLGEAVLSAGA
jgi:GT2 family glycosyltransferase